VNRQSVLAVALAIGATLSLPAQASIDTARAKGLKWLVQAQQGDGAFVGAQGIEVQATAAAVEAMLAGGMTKSPQYARALSWLANAPGSSLDSRAWQAMALAGAGRDASSITNAIRDERNTSIAVSGSITGGYAAWGAYPGFGSSIPDTALGYGALRTAGLAYTNDTTELTVTMLCAILPAQLAGAPWVGAWPHSLPQSGQPAAVSPGSLAATSIMLYETKKQRQASRFLSGSACGRSSPAAIDAAMTSAKTWLLAQTNGDGGFAERSPQTGSLEASHPLATAMAVRALALFAAEGDTAATTAVNNARNWLAGQQGADGSWRGDPFVTARVLAALPAATGAQIADADGDGLPDVVETQLGSQTTVADAQRHLANDAQAEAGVTATSFTAAGILGQPFAHLLTADGTVPISYALVGGALPPGLALASGGQITGTPTNLGSYAFDYEATDAGGAKARIIGRIDIANASAGADGDVPLPAWALFALGASLLAALRRKTS
jgi:hypothetical protein